ncbi:hypothetical protein BDF14DRAFT_1737405, partial [Spinellus fusiger]
LHSESVSNYWDVMKLKNMPHENAVKQYDLHKKSYPKNKEIFEIDGLMLQGLKKSAGSMIKQAAVNIVESTSSYTTLSSTQKKTVSLGLNSIVDLSDNSSNDGSQQSLFNEEAWQELKTKVYDPRDLPPLPANIEKY